MSISATEQLYAALANIPQGKVVTYGQLAALAGRPKAARWVGQVLKKLPEDSTLPWFRVINSQGKISFPLDSEPAKQQAKLLRADGIDVSDNNKINLQCFGF